MNLSFKKLFFLWTILALMPFAMVGCKKKGSVSSCKTDSDCRVDASGKEINGVCYMGKCEECVKDKDCPDLKQCVNNRCLSTCSIDADCGAGNHCERNYCMPDCISNESCGENQICSQGRCMAQADSADPKSWASAECHDLGKVHFDFDRYVIKPEYAEEVKKLAECLKTNPGIQVTISGHADDRGTPAYNLALGEKRSKAVQEQLTSLGIANNRINTVSFGDQQPLVNEKTEYAWQQNRRAEFVLRRE